MQETWDTGSAPGLGRCPREEHGNNASVFAWRISWTEEAGRLQSIASHRVEPDSSDLTHTKHFRVVRISENWVSFVILLYLRNEHFIIKSLNGAEKSCEIFTSIVQRLVIFLCGTETIFTPSQRPWEPIDQHQLRSQSGDREGGQRERPWHRLWVCVLTYPWGSA